MYSMLDMGPGMLFVDDIRFADDITLAQQARKFFHIEISLFFSKTDETKLIHD